MALTIKQLERVKYLRSSIVCDALLGNYKNFKNAKKEYATLAIKDFDTVRKLPAPKATASIFSRQGLNILLVNIIDMFRIKTPDEKLLKRMGQEMLKKSKINSFI